MAKKTKLAKTQGNLKPERKFPKFFIVDAADWQALYVDGKCVYQHHEVDFVHELKKYGIDISSAWAEGDPVLRDCDQWPENLKDVVFDEDPQGFQLKLQLGSGL